MADPDANKPQVTDPATVADMVRLLQIRGSVGVLDVADVVVPTINLGDVTPRSITVRQRSFRPTDVFTNGVQVGAAALTIHAGTGPLPAGTYDCHFMVQPASQLVGPVDIAIQWRNAADSGTIADLGQNLVGSNVNGQQILQFDAALELINDERLRILNIGALAGSVRSYGVIFARIR